MSLSLIDPSSFGMNWTVTHEILMQSLVFFYEDNFRGSFKEDLQFNSSMLHAIRRKLSGLEAVCCNRIVGQTSNIP
jgi:hypothetical protein